MAEIRGVNLERLFVPEADLSVYDTMSGRELYLAMMRGVFEHQGKPTDERTIMKKVAYISYREAAKDSDATKTDQVIPVVGAEGREMRVETRAMDDYYPGVSWTWGPLSTLTLSAINDGKKVRLSTSARQEHEQLFLGARATILDPLTGNELQGEDLVKSLWVGNVDGTEVSPDALAAFHESVFRDITPAEKRVVGIALQGLGQLALTGVQIPA